MTKNQLAKEVAVSEKLHLSTTVQTIDGLLRVVKDALVKGEPLYLRGFGSFHLADVAERTARNIKTGEPLIIPAHKSVKFRIAKEFNNALNHNEEGKEANV